MFQRPSARRQLIERIVVSVFAVVIVTVGVFVTVLFMLGYRLESGTLEQGALLQIDSNPRGAAVLIDGQEIGSRTATKQTVLAGSHTVSLRRDKYEPWTRTIDLVAGTLTWLDYARLVPKDRPVDTVFTYDTLDGALAAPGGKTFVLQASKKEPRLTLVDISRSSQVDQKTLTLPEDLYSAGASHTFTLQEWDQGGRYLLVRHDYDTTTEWLVVDTRELNKSQNVTRSLSVAFTQLGFLGTDGYALYGLTTDGIVRKLDLEAQTISRVLLRQVKSFDINHTTKVLTYLGTDGSGEDTMNVAGIYRDGDQAGHIVYSTTKNEPLFIATSSYRGDDYVAVAHEGTVMLLAGEYPSSSQEDIKSLKERAVLSMEEPVTKLLFSGAGDFLVATSKTVVMGYEIDHDRTSRSVLESGVGVLDWLDNAHLWDSGNGVLTMRDFEGSNAYTIMPIESNFDATLDSEGDFMYGIGRQDDGIYAFQRVSMTAR